MGLCIAQIIFELVVHSLSETLLF